MALTSTGSGVITDPSNDPIEGVVVIAKLRPVSSAVRVDDQTAISGELRAVTDVNGEYTLELEQNGNITPANTYWEIEERIPRSKGGTRNFAIVVPAIDFNIYTTGIITVPEVEPRTVLTIEAADLRYILHGFGVADTEFGTVATFGDLPASGVPNRYCWVEDDNELYRDNGTVWELASGTGGGGGGGGFTQEQVEDIVGAMFSGNTETGITVDYDDVTGKINLVVAGGGGFTQEQIEDFVGAMVSGNTETGVTVTYDDTAAKLNFALDNEVVEDVVGAMVSGNTETGISVTYNDATNKLDFSVTGTWTQEQIEDLIGAMVTGNTETGITVDYDDTNGKLDFVVSGGGGGFTQEQIEDFVGAMFSGNTETGIAATYDDTNGKIDLVVSPAPSELGYAESTTAFSTSSTTPVDVTGLSITVTVGTRPIVIEAGGYLLSPATANSFCVMRIYEGGTILAEANVKAEIASAHLLATSCKRRLTPSAGSHTYKVMLYRISGSGNVSMSNSPDFPGYIMATEV